MQRGHRPAQDRVGHHRIVEERQPDRASRPVGEQVADQVRGMCTIRYVKPRSSAACPSCGSSGLKAITMPALLVCAPPRHRKDCAPASVTPKEYVSWLCR
ncbi:hypothetical protein Prum_022320 [Phytohabitans rumicis]|uniref:Transposase zinc-binding domain-containing protein n=1 Tax=Phytohabitans rumicis TaxID=1076125 RepID=A0A6V8KZ00_9ACTN|nr:hypothetical protein [Phytohabitans rumicis]GFJ88590.1 hypothetical protein Prum_022320 [Phytohabitans rumicis]